MTHDEHTRPEVIQALRDSRLSAEMDADELVQIAPLMHLRDCTAGQVLALEGAADSHLHAVVRGALEVVKDHGTPQAERLLTVSPGELTHELGFLDGSPRYASLVAQGATRVLQLERSQLEGLVDAHPRILYKLMRAIVRAAHGSQVRQARQSNELLNYIVKQHGRY
jgi:CRP-like cAMP-binding protein